LYIIRLIIDWVKKGSVLPQWVYLVIQVSPLSQLWIC